MRHAAPFSIVELPEFRSVLNLLKLGVAIPSDTTLKCDLVKHHRDRVDALGERVRNAGSKISVTLDCWTSSNNKAFLGIHLGGTRLEIYSDSQAAAHMMIHVTAPTIIPAS